MKKVASDGTVSTVTVTTGESSGTVTEITAGLSEGDDVQVTTYARTSTGGTGSTNQNQQGFTGFPGGGTGSFTLPNGTVIQPGQGFQGGNSGTGSRG